MATDYYIGQNVRIGIGINAEVAGMTFDESVGTFDCMKLAPGGSCKIEHRNTKTDVEEVDVDPEDYVAGGEIHTITCDVVMSYSYREKIFQLFAGGVLTAGGAGPFTYAQVMADKLLNGGFFVEYTKQSKQVNEIIRDTYTNFVVSAATLKESAEGYATLSFSGTATGRSRDDADASLTTVQTTETLKWGHLTVTLDGTVTKCSEIGFDLGAALAEGEYEHGSTSQDGNWRKGPRGIRWNVVVMENDTTYALGTDITALWDAENSFKWDNGAAAGANRKFEVIFGDSYIESSPEVKGIWGRQPRPFNMKAQDGATAVLDIDWTNGRASIPA